MIRATLLCLGVTLIVALGFMIDAQSHKPAVRGASHPAQCTIFAPGRVEGATPEVELRPRLEGRIVRLLVQEGQSVEAGEVLLELDDQQYRCQVALAAAELATAKAQLERLVNGAHHLERAEAAALYRAKRSELHRAEVSWKRINQLREARAIAQQKADDQRSLVDSLEAEVEAAKARLQRLEAETRADELRVAEARIQAAEARLQLAKVQLERTRLRAPGNGQILKTGVEIGELAGPTSAEPAIVMADISKLYVRAFVEEMDAPRVQIGMSAKIRADGLPDCRFDGRVTRVSPRMGRKQLWSNQPAERFDTKTREIWIELPGGEQLVLGLRVDVMIDPDSVTARP